jgi:hypothetical protein
VQVPETSYSAVHFRVQLRDVFNQFPLISSHQPETLFKGSAGLLVLVFAFVV